MTLIRIGKWTQIATLALAITAAGGCATDGNSEHDKRNKGAVIGAITGAAAGALIGGATGAVVLPLFAVIQIIKLDAELLAILPQRVDLFP